VLQMVKLSLRDRISAKLRGFRSVQRGFALSTRVSDGAYRLFNILVDLCDWDPNHVNSYGLVNFSAEDLAKLLKCDEATVYRRLKELREASLLRPEGNRIWVSRPELFDHRSLAKLQPSLANLQEEVAKLQTEDGENPSDKANPDSTYKFHIRSSVSTGKVRNSGGYGEPVLKERTTTPKGGKTGNLTDSHTNKNLTKRTCFCGSGKDLEDCCGKFVDESLEGVRY